MSQYDDFPFDMTDVMGLLSFETKRPGSNGWYVNCPFCKDSKRKMHVNLKKNVFRCNRCGEHGGMLALYAGVYGIDNKTAYEEIMDLLNKSKADALGKDSVIDGSKRTGEPNEAETVMTQEEAKLAPVEVRNKVYSLLLSALVLSEKHREDLLARGFSLEQIEQCGYRSTPVFGFKRFARQLLEAGCDLQGVPGFFQEEDDTWNINFKSQNSGFLIPVRDLEGNIQALQIRLDRPHEGCKYFWLSSIGLRSGVSSGSPVHFVGDAQDKTIYVTEGGLKGDLAHHLSGRSFLCQPGVTQHVHLIPALKVLSERGINRVYEAFDMDKLLDTACRHDCAEKCRQCDQADSRDENVSCPRKEMKLRNIQSGCSKLQEVCSSLQIEYIPLVWDRDENGRWKGNIKGIDDYLVSLKRK